MSDPATATPLRVGAGAIVALSIAAATMFAIPYSTQAIVPEVGRDLGVGPAVTGLTITVVVVGIALGAWLMGPLSDRIGRRRVMLGSCALLVIPTMLIIFVQGIVELLVLRSLQGLLLPGLLTVATAYVYEAFPADRVATVVGIYTSALVLGGFLGRTIPSLLVAEFGWRASLAALAIPMLLSAVLIRALLPVAPPPPKARSPLRAVRAHIRNTPLLLNALAAGCTFFAFVGLFSVIAYRLESSVFGLSQRQVGAFYIVWLVGALAPFAVRWAGRLGPRTVLPIFPLIGALGLALGSLPNLIAVIVGLAILAGGLFSMVGVAQLLVPQLTLRDRGSAMSLHLTIYYVLGSLGPFMLGAAWSTAGWTGAALLALLALVTAFVLTLLLRRSVAIGDVSQAGSEPVLS
ncbi:MAG: MFS transporter [Thermoleophilia bacterium]|nr:MFS transporter [Thermoleophilia bacterium]